MPLLFHNEPIVRDEKIVGYISSANYGHTLGSAVGLGYVPCSEERIDDVLKSDFQVEIAGKRHNVIASRKPMYDPKAKRMRV